MRKSISLAVLVAGILVYSACDKKTETKYVYLTGGPASDQPGPGPQPSPTQEAADHFDIYKDGGGSLNTDPQTLSFGVDGVYAEVRPLADAGEGGEYLRVHEDNGDGGRWVI